VSRDARLDIAGLAPWHLFSYVAVAIRHEGKMTLNSPNSAALGSSSVYGAEQTARPMNETNAQWCPPNPTIIWLTSCPRPMMGMRAPSLSRMRLLHVPRQTMVMKHV